MKKSIMYLSLAVLFVSTLSTSIFVLAKETQAGEIKAPEEVSLVRERIATANQKKCFAVKGEPDTKRVTVNRGDNKNSGTPGGRNHPDMSHLCRRGNL
ncbi:MAG: hypothetical protein PHU61_00245 [Candidatus Absconditabacteria bacterium]|nr:hypothetical protein [Candidatus Absconditabacteria bacterium]MDD3868642.1 hypothetical protein [Candidatus Absconditabacteria bacterium]MDD4714162.1 hypothetical protein [Candidatus Absconditabacteria bacterium]